MAATNYTPIQLYYSSTATNTPLAANLAAGELAINTADGKLYFKNSSGAVTLLASAAGASGDVVGPASATDNALARFDLTTGKLIQNSVGILSDAGVLTGLTGLTSSGSITLSSLTSGRVPYATTAGLLTDSANLLYSGTDLTVYGLTVGRGAGAVATNTAVGASALASGSQTGINNTAIGQTALTSNTSGNENSALGRQALYSNTTGGSNSGLGMNTLVDNTTGSYNTAVGRSALQSNTTAAQNTAVGYAALYSNTTGTANTAVGALGGSYTALNNNTSGSYNTAMGNGALGQNTTASNNTAVGYQAGYSGTTGVTNTYLGVQAGYSGTTSNANVGVGSYSLYTSTGGGNTGLGYAAGQFVTTGTLNTYVGYLSGNSMTSGSKNVILGSYNGNQNGLDMRTISNVVVLSDGDGTLIMNAQKDASIALQGAITKTGIGITFPATQSASIDANTLDDYEEGTWTPIITNGTTNVTSYFYNIGRYTKIGRSVSITMQISVNVVGISSGTLSITGLPFPMADTEITSQTANSMLGFKYYPVTGTVLYQINSATNTTMGLAYPASYPTGISYADIATGGQWYLNATYFTT